MTTSNSSLSPNKNTVFECKQHDAYIYQKLQNLYKDNVLFDIVLIADAGNDNDNSDPVKISAHRIVLCALSEYFWEIFHCNGPNAEQPNELQLKDIDASTLKLILDYMYSGSVELNLENVETLLLGAVYLKMKKLINGCCDFVIKNLNNKNCLYWFRLAKKLSLSKLQAISSDIIYQNLSGVIEDTEFMHLDKEELKGLLIYNNSYPLIEEQVFLGMLNWIQYKIVEREHLILELFSMIRYQFLTPKFIIQNRKSITTTVESCKMIFSWLEYHLCPESRTIEQNLSLEKFKFNEKKCGIVLLYISNSNEAIFQYSGNVSELFSLKEASGTASYTASVIGIDTKVYLVGGLNKSNQVLNDFQCIDLATLKLSNILPMKTARYKCELADLDGYLCAFGGFKEADYKHFIESVEIYNFSTLQWTELHLPFELDSSQRIAGHNGILYIFQKIDKASGILHTYDISSNQWKTKMVGCNYDQFSLEDYQIVVVGEFLYYIGRVKRPDSYSTQIQILSCNLAKYKFYWCMESLIHENWK